MMRVQKDKTAKPLNAKRLLAKAVSLTSEGVVEESSAMSAINDRETVFSDNNAIVPDYDPESLLSFIEISPHLTPNISAYAQNIDGYGHQCKVIEPWMEDLDSQESFDAVKEALLIEEWADAEDAAREQTEKIHELMERRDGLLGQLERAQKDDCSGRTIRKWESLVEETQEQIDSAQGAPTEEQPSAVTDEVVKKKIEELKIQIRRETYLYNAFFKNCCSDMSFVRLKRIVRTDIESHGWGTIEFERDGYGILKRLSYIPAYTIRPMRDDGELIDVIEDDSITPLSEGREVMVKRRFKRYVQIVGSKKIYFKSPGDPRVVSRLTGKVYESERDMRHPDAEGKDAVPANELLWMSLHSAKTSCPPPRWVGNLLQVLGGREADETNYYYLKNDAIPYGLLFVAGGVIRSDVKERIENRLSAEFRGGAGAGKILVVNAQAGTRANADERSMIPKIEFQSLREAHNADSLFTKYDERGADRIGASFRLSPMLRGYTPSTLNRATATAAIAMAESQVFQPEREDTDWIFNKYVLPEIGLKYVKMVSNSPPTRNVEDVTTLIQAAASHGGLLPNEIRAMLSDLLNRPIANVQEDWAKQPMPMTLAGITPGGNTEIDAENAALYGQLATIEQRVKSVVHEELSLAGMNVDIRTSWVEPKKED